jgi:purine nucleosidase
LVTNAEKIDKGPTRVILDCDPGHDDAVAILVAAGSPRAELLGITTVGGNQTLERVTRNACAIATVAGLDVPVVPGCEQPLLRRLQTAPEYHGESGLEGAPPVSATVKPAAGHAVDFIISTVLAMPGEVTLVATGPLTNLAVALSKAPEVAGAVRRVVLMGGSCSRGNVTPAAEFNIFVDPEAAAIVFGAGWDITMIGLDVTHQALYTPAVDERVAAIDSEAARWIRPVLDAFRVSYTREADMPSPPVHDPCALIEALEPGIVDVRDAHVNIETAGTYTSGMTVVDFAKAAVSSRQHVGVGLNAEAFWDRVVDSLTALGH